MKRPARHDLASVEIACHGPTIRPEVGWWAVLRIVGMNHVVLYVRDALRSAAFYRQVLGFRLVVDDPAGRFVFLRAADSVNHHDLALFTVGREAGEPTRGEAVGLYHLAWQVATIEDLLVARDRLAAAGVLAGASDHGVNKSVYGRDPDGIEFEVMFLTPLSSWGEAEHQAVIRPLDLPAEARRWAGQVTA